MPDVVFPEVVKSYWLYNLVFLRFGASAHECALDSHGATCRLEHTFRAEAMSQHSPAEPTTDNKVAKHVLGQRFCVDSRMM